MPDQLHWIQEALTAYRKDSDREAVDKAEEERAEFLTHFPLEGWPNLSLERYALGQADSEDTFCRWMEFRTNNLGSMRGGSAHKLMVYKHKDKPGWYFDSAYKQEQEAWKAVRGGFVQAFEKARAKDWNAIDEIVPLQAGPMLRLKTLHVYFPEDLAYLLPRSHSALLATPPKAGGGGANL